MIFSNKPHLLSIIVGVVIITFSTLHILLDLIRKDRGAAFIINTVVFSVGIIFGIVLAVLGDTIVKVLVTALAMIIIIDASYKLNTARQAKRFGVKSWWAIITLSLISIALCFFVLMYNPELEAEIKIARISVILLSIALILDGTSNILGLFYIPSLERRANSAIYYEMYRKEFQKK